MSSEGNDAGAVEKPAPASRCKHGAPPSWREQSKSGGQPGRGETTASGIVQTRVQTPAQPLTTCVTSEKHFTFELQFINLGTGMIYLAGFL